MVRIELVLKTRSLGPPRTSRLSTISGVTRGMMKKSLEVGRREANLELLRTRPRESLAYIRQPQLRSCDRSSSRSLKLSFPPTPILAVSGDGLRSQTTSFSIVLTHPFITWTIFLFIVFSRPTLPLFFPLSDDPHSPTPIPLAY